MIREIENRGDSGPPNRKITRIGVKREPSGNLNIP